MSSSISGLHYEENQIGGAFKSSKIEYIWEFVLNGTSPNKIELIYSKWSGKKRLIKNGVEVFDKNNDGSFLKNFEIEGHIFSIMQYGEKCELRVDNQSFTHLYNLEKNKNFFTGEDDPTSKTQIAKNCSDNLSYENDEGNLYKYKIKENGKKEEKQGLFDFKIKVDESKQNSGLKKFKFGPGIKCSYSALEKNKINENNNNKNNDLLGFGDIIQNDNDNNSNNLNNNNDNNNDIFGFGITNNNNDKKIDNNNTNNNDLFNFGNNDNENNNNKNNKDFLNFGSNSDNINNNNNNVNQNSNTKTTNIDQLADVFSAFAQSNNNQINETKEKNQENQDNNNNIEQENKENTSNNNFFAFNPSSANQTNFFNLNQDFTKNENNNNFGFFNPEPKEENKISTENEEVNYPKLEEINNQDNNNNTNNNNSNVFTFNFVPQESNNFNNIEGFKPSPSGFDYDAFNKAKKNEPTTNNDKLDNALQNLF